MTEKNLSNGVHLFDVTFTPKDSKRLLRRLRLEQEKGTLRNGTVVLLRFDRNVALELAQDLMAVGRVLWAVQLLQQELSCEVHIEFVGTKVSPTLLELGLPRYLAGIGVRLLHPHTTQTSLFPDDQNGDTAETVPGEFQVLAHRSYSRCLIPITPMTIEIAQGKRSLDDVASREIAKVEALLRSEVTKLLSEPEGLLSELAIAILPAVRELVGNAVQHSCSPVYIIAATLSRTLGFTTEVGARRKIDVLYSPIFQLLVADFGVGIVRSVHKTLWSHQDPMAKSASLWDLERAKDAEHYSIESALMQSLFSGTLAIRRGRTSEGLRDVQRAVEWCNGQLEFRSGQSEATVRPTAYVGRPTIAVDTTPDGWDLGGVIARVVAPSRELLALELKQIAKDISATSRTVSRSLRVERFELSSGMLGASPTPPLQRRSEIDSEEIVNRLRQLSQAREEKMLALDFRRANVADIDYLDALMQEIAKRARDTPGLSTVLTGWLVITSMPRSIIFALRRRNCQALLMSQSAPLLVFDDVDQPHFLGVPRFSKGALDAEEALWITQLVGHVDVKELELQGFAPDAIAWLIAMAKQLDSPLLRLTQEKDAIVLEAASVAAGLRRYRAIAVESINKFIIRERDSVFQLANGATVSALVDFCLLWSDAETLRDCADTLCAETKIPSCDVVVAFMNNGDRLANAILRHLGFPSLAIIDPHDNARWLDSESPGRVVVVVDAVYPHDDNSGYIFEFINFVKTEWKTATLQSIVAFADFREVRGSSISGVSVMTPSSGPSVFPTEQSVAKGSRILRPNYEYRLSKPTEVDHAEGLPRRKVPPPFRYSTVELLTEFWQHVSTFQLLSAERNGRESRSVVFYENNERLLKNPRLRQIVGDFVSSFVKHDLGGRVDVILHPTHSVGSLLAQFVAERLPSSPLILPIHQHRYGGALQFTHDDFSYYAGLVDTRRSHSKGEVLRCIVIDDSVISGGSLFTMLGIAHRLTLVPTGAMVLLSRLTPATSEILSSLPITFRYLYRLHMTLVGDEDPYNRIRVLNTEVYDHTCSPFALKHCHRIRSNHVATLAILVQDCSSQPAPKTDVDWSSDEAGGVTESHELQHVLRNLLLHPDANVLSFETRLAILYNFLERLAREHDFWKLLDALAPEKSNASDNSQELGLFRGALFLLTFSSFSHAFSVKSAMELLVIKILNWLAERNEVLKYPNLASECAMSLAALGSAQALHIFAQLVSSVSPVALATDSSELAKIGTDGEEENKEKKDVALRLICSISWAVALSHCRTGSRSAELELTSPGDLAELPQQAAIEARLLLIDAIADPLRSSLQLRNAFGIDSSMYEVDSFVTELEDAFHRDEDIITKVDSDASKSFAYLRRAPGFTCTLFSILRATMADTVLVYVRGKTDSSPFLRVFESRNNVRPSNAMDDKHLRALFLGQRISQRMQRGLPFYSHDPQETVLLDDFALKTKHTRALGMPLSTDASTDIQYFIVLGYCGALHESLGCGAIFTSYFFLRRLDRIIFAILCDIQERHIESSAAWNIQVQLLSSPHAERTDDCTEPGNRRRFVRRVFSRLDSVEMLRSSVQHADPTQRLEDLRLFLASVSSTLFRHVKDENAELHSLAGKDVSNAIAKFAPDTVKLWTEKWPITIRNVYLPDEKSTYCAVHKSVLEFIAFECLRNALIYGDGEISFTIRFGATIFDETTGFDRSSVTLEFENAVVELGKRGIGIGLGSCAAAANAVGGEFRHNRDVVQNDQSVPFKAEVTIPTAIVPTRLRNHLREMLK